MNMHPAGRPREKIAVVRDQRSALRQITAQQLLQLGTNQIVYLKAGISDGKPLVVLYGADGEPLALVETVETAVAMAAEHGLAFVSVH